MLLSEWNRLKRLKWMAASSLCLMNEYWASFPGNPYQTAPPRTQELILFDPKTYEIRFYFRVLLKKIKVHSRCIQVDLQLQAEVLIDRGVSTTEFFKENGKARVGWGKNPFSPQRSFLRRKYSFDFNDIK